MSWKVSVVPPRKSKREKNLQLRAWRTELGKVVEEHRITTGTTNPLKAEALCASYRRWLEDPRGLAENVGSDSYHR